MIRYNFLREQIWEWKSNIKETIIEISDDGNITTEDNFNMTLSFEPYSAEE